jgi:hypothetical protein
MDFAKVLQEPESALAVNGASIGGVKMAGTAESFYFVGHGFEKPGPDTLPEHLAEQIRGFPFFALQEAAFGFW